MKDSEIRSFFMTQLTGALPFERVVPENCDSLPEKPYITIDLVPLSRSNQTLSGGFERSRGFCQLSLVSETNEDIGSSTEKAEEIAAVFPYRLRHGDELVITKPPLIEKGYRDGPDWRTPIRVDYETCSQT